jgi:hypothetical protein
VYTSSYFGNPNCFPYFDIDEGYTGAIRDDSLLNKVFFQYPDSTSDYLLYDYNLSIGDTIASYVTGNGTVVTNIDSIQIDGSFRKRWHYNNWSDGSEGYFIQGYGSSSGLIERHWSLQIAKLICVKNEIETIYTTGVFSPLGCNEVYLNTDELSQIQLDISPIPANKYLQLSFQKERIISQNDVQVFNSFGSFIACNYNSETGTLDVSNLTSCLYYIKFFLDERFISKRFVIAK